jgi:glycosyltransferase involved in cell wall biosynthesis
MSSKFRHSKKSRIKFIFFCLWQALRIALRGEKIDLVVTYDPLASGITGFIISRILRAKLITEVNGVYTSSTQLLDIPNMLEAFSKKYLYPLIMRFVLKRADGIQLLFEKQIDLFKTIVRTKKIKAFPCYVPIEQFKYIREDKEILLAGFPFRLKGTDVMIAAFKKLAVKYPDWKLKILGWFPNVTELNNAMGGHPQIFHHPPVKYSEMPAHIGACAIVVLPSRSEAMGRVLVEAMAAGKPRIGSNVDGIPSVINDGVDGFLVEPGNVDDLCAKLDKLMGSPELRQELGRAGEHRANSEFSEQIYFNNLINFYNEVMEK